MPLSPFHECNAPGCHEQIHRRYLMCGPHWAMLPGELQADVHAHLRAWRKGGSVRPYYAATLRARLYLANALRFPVAAENCRARLAVIEDGKPVTA